VLRIIMLAKSYNKLPSEIMNIDDEYTAYCFDEACDEIVHHINNKETPVFEKHYSSFRDFYKQFS